MPGEREPTDFAYHYARYQTVSAFRADVHLLLDDWKEQLCQRHAALARVKQLEPDASLMDIFVATTAVRGRPLAEDGKKLTTEHEKQQAYMGISGFTGDFMVKMVDAEQSSGPLKGKREQ
eukprot:1096184-Prymnesium_polylepis.1